MTFESSAFNSTDVVRNHYGPRKIKDFGGHVSTEGNIKYVSYMVDLAEEITGAPATSNVLLDPAKGKMEVLIPAYAKIVSAECEVVEALSTTAGSAAAAASIQLGLDKATDGTALDVDGLIDAVDGALTIASNDIAEPKGSWLKGWSADLVGNTLYDGDDTGAPLATTTGENISIGSVAGQLTAKLVIDDITDMTAVAGKVRFIVAYMDSRSSPVTSYVAGGVQGA